MAEKSETKPRGVGFWGLLTILFIGLKLTGHIDWNWLLVLSPLAAPFAVDLAFFGLMVAVVIIPAFFGLIATAAASVYDWLRK